MHRHTAFLLTLLALAAPRIQAATLATINTTVGTIELELYDDDKPITVSNFVKYVTSGIFTNQFIQRWDPDFVIQAGGFRTTNTANGTRIAQNPTYGNIKNEYSVGRTFSNTYGTIAMARSDAVDSASSQWFLNLNNRNSFLDNVNQGFTVFGRVTGGTNVLNLFIPGPPTNNIHLLNLGSAGLTELPVLTNKVDTLAVLFANLIYFDIKLRRDLDLTVSATRPGQRRVSWNSVAGVTNILEFTSGNVTNWNTYTNVRGTGATLSFIDTSSDLERLYRVKLFY